MVPFENKYLNLKVNYLAGTLTASGFNKIYLDYSNLIWASNSSVFKLSAVYLPIYIFAVLPKTPETFFLEKVLNF